MGCIICVLPDMTENKHHFYGIPAKNAQRDSTPDRPTLGFIGQNASYVFPKTASDIKRQGNASELPHM